MFGQIGAVLLQAPIKVVTRTVITVAHLGLYQLGQGAHPDIGGQLGEMVLRRIGDPVTAPVIQDRAGDMMLNFPCMLENQFLPGGILGMADVRAFIKSDSPHDMRAHVTARFTGRLEHPRAG
jgi:hypothetical protein